MQIFHNLNLFLRILCLFGAIQRQKHPQRQRIISKAQTKAGTDMIQLNILRVKINCIIIRAAVPQTLFHRRITAPKSGRCFYCGTGSIVHTRKILIIILQSSRKSLIFSQDTLICFTSPSEIPRKLCRKTFQLSHVSKEALHLKVKRLCHHCSFLSASPGISA